MLKRKIGQTSVNGSSSSRRRRTSSEQRDDRAARRAALRENELKLAEEQGAERAREEAEARRRQLTQAAVFGRSAVLQDAILDEGDYAKSAEENRNGLQVSPDISMSMEAADDKEIEEGAAKREASLQETARKVADMLQNEKVTTVREAAEQVAFKKAAQASTALKKDVRACAAAAAEQEATLREVADQSPKTKESVKNKAKAALAANPKLVKPVGEEKTSFYDGVAHEKHYIYLSVEEFKAYMMERPILENARVPGGRPCAQAGIDEFFGTTNDASVDDEEMVDAETAELTRQSLAQLSGKPAEDGPKKDLKPDESAFIAVFSVGEEALEDGRPPVIKNLPPAEDAQEEREAPDTEDPQTQHDVQKERESPLEEGQTAMKEAQKEREWASGGGPPDDGDDSDSDDDGNGERRDDDKKNANSADGSDPSDSCDSSENEDNGSKKRKKQQQLGPSDRKFLKRMVGQFEIGVHNEFATIVTAITNLTNAVTTSAGVFERVAGSAANSSPIPNVQTTTVEDTPAQQENQHAENRQLAQSPLPDYEELARKEEEEVAFRDTLKTVARGIVMRDAVIAEQRVLNEQYSHIVERVEEGDVEVISHPDHQAYLNAQVELDQRERSLTRMIETAEAYDTIEEDDVAATYMVGYFGADGEWTEDEVRRPSIDPITAAEKDADLFDELSRFEHRMADMYNEYRRVCEIISKGDASPAEEDDEGQELWYLAQEFQALSRQWIELQARGHALRSNGSTISNEQKEEAARNVYSKGARLRSAEFNRRDEIRIENEIRARYNAELERRRQAKDDYLEEQTQILQSELERLAPRPDQIKAGLDDHTVETEGQDKDNDVSPTEDDVEDTLSNPKDGSGDEADSSNGQSDQEKSGGDKGDKGDRESNEVGEKAGEAFKLKDDKPQTRKTGDAWKKLLRFIPEAERDDSTKQTLGLNVDQIACGMFCVLEAVKQDKSCRSSIYDITSLKKFHQMGPDTEKSPRSRVSRLHRTLYLPWYCGEHKSFGATLPKGTEPFWTLLTADVPGQLSFTRTKLVNGKEVEDNNVDRPETENTDSRPQFTLTNSYGPITTENGNTTPAFKRAGKINLIRQAERAVERLGWYHAQPKYYEGQQNQPEPVTFAGATEKEAAYHKEAWHSGIHVILNAWCKAFDLQLNTNFRSDEEFLRVAYKVINYAINGNASSELIFAFLVWSDYIQWRAGDKVAEDRRFALSVRLRDGQEVKQRWARELALEAELDKEGKERRFDRLR